MQCMSNILSIAEVRRRLPVGMQMEVEYLRGTLVVHGNTGQTTIPPTAPQHRIVIKQTTHKMESKRADGKVVHLEWRGVTAKEVDDGAIVLSAVGVGEFVRITPVEQK